MNFVHLLEKETVKINRLQHSTAIFQKAIGNFSQQAERRIKKIVRRINSTRRKFLERKGF